MKESDLGQFSLQCKRIYTEASLVVVFAGLRSSQHGHLAVAQRVVEKRLDLAAAVGAFLEVYLEQVLQRLRVRHVRDPRQHHTPTAQLRPGLKNNVRKD